MIKNKLNNKNGGSKEIINNNYIVSQDYFNIPTITNQNIKFCKNYFINKKLNGSKRSNNINNIFEISKNIYKFFMTNMLFFHNDYYDLYTALPPFVFIPSYIRSIINNDYSFGRFIRPKNFNILYNNINEFISEINNEIILKYNNTKISSNISANIRHIDKNDKYRPNLVSTNTSLFGNEYGKSSGESSFDYYIKGSTQLKFSFEKYLSVAFFCDFEYLKYKYMYKIIEIIKKVKKGFMVQVLFPKELIHKYAYLCYSYGVPILNYNNIEKLNYNNIQKLNYIDKFFSIEDPIKRLNMIKELENSFKNLNFFKKIQSLKINDDDCFKINNIQARIVITKELINDKNILFSSFNENKNLNNDLFTELVKLSDEIKYDIDNKNDIDEYYKSYLIKNNNINKNTNNKFKKIINNNMLKLMYNDYYLGKNAKYLDTLSDCFKNDIKLYEEFMLKNIYENKNISIDYDYNNKNLLEFINYKGNKKELIITLFNNLSTRNTFFSIKRYRNT